MIVELGSSPSSYGLQIVIHTKSSFLQWRNPRGSVGLVALLQWSHLRAIEFCEA